MTTIIRHESETIGLAELARKVEDNGRGYNDAIKHVGVGHFGDFDSFMSYFSQHYRPMLEQLRLSNPHDNLLCLFCDDMLDIFKEES